MDKTLKAASDRAAADSTVLVRRGYPEQPDVPLDTGKADALLKTGALQKAIFNSANFSSIATDA